MSFSSCRNCGTAWDAGESWEKDRKPDCPVCYPYQVRSKTQAEHALDAVIDWIGEQGNKDDALEDLRQHAAARETMTAAFEKALENQRTEKT